MPDTATELSTAHDSYTAAATLTGWTLLYLAARASWWPALIIATLTRATAWTRARAPPPCSLPSRNHRRPQPKLARLPPIVSMAVNSGRKKDPAYGTG